MAAAGCCNSCYLAEVSLPPNSKIFQFQMWEEFTPSTKRNKQFLILIDEILRNLSNLRAGAGAKFLASKKCI